MSSRSQPDPRFSVIVVTYNSRETLPACLESLRRAFAGTPGMAECIAVDNASRDGTGEILKGNPEVRSILNAENHGFARACNQGARVARGEFLLFLNPDALLTAGAAERMAAAFTDPLVGAAGPVSTYVAGLQQLDRHWSVATEGWGKLPGTALLEKSEALAAILQEAHAGAVLETKLLIGFCLMLPRDLYAALGGMDENLFLGNDDLDLCWRLRLKGRKLAVARDAFVYHEGQKSFRTDPKPVVDALVRESTDALFRKLSLHYGGDDKVPSPAEMWGIGWFQPSPRARFPAPVPSPSASTRTQEVSMVIATPFLQYPETLRPHLREAEQVAFIGSAVVPVPVSGPVQGVGLRGEKVALENQDLVVLRISPDLVDDLPGRLRNLRDRMPKLRGLSVVFDSRQALGRPPHPRGFEVPVDLTSGGAAAALRLAGYRIAAAVPYSGFPGLRAEGRSPEGWWQLDAEPRAREHRRDALTSIVILGFNQVEYTRQCVESIRRNVRQRHELILVDNGSRDATWEYFRSVPGAVAIRNETNLGVAAGWNQGLRAAKGETLLVLNNDTLVFPGMIENLVRLCESDPAIGIAGPRCNRIAAAQAVDGASYHTREEMETFARAWQERQDLAHADFDWIKGTCMLLTRAAFEKIGFFDERYGKGNFEDDDYCLRARYLGFRTCIAHDSYLHHFGSVSFGQENVDWTALMRENQRKFSEKWSRGAEALGDVQSGWNAQGKAAYERGDLAGARQAFSRALQADPADAEALSALGALSYHSQQYRDAILLSMRSLMNRPGDEDTALNALEALKALNGTVTATELDALRRRFPGNSAFLSEAGSKSSWTPVTEKPDAWLREMENLVRARKYADALDEVERKLKAGEKVAACHNFMGIIAMDLGHAGEAMGHFGRALDAEPVWEDALANCFDAALAARDRATAVRRVENALSAVPGHAMALRMRRHLEREGDAIFAARSFDSLEEDRPEEGVRRILGDPHPSPPPVEIPPSLSHG